MIPFIKDDKVIVPDSKLASTLFNKGSFGKPISGGGSRLSLVEAAYLLENERLELKRSRKGRKADLAFVLKRGISKDRMFMENFLVFRDLRSRGLVVQGGGKGCFSSFPRGKRPDNGRADAWVKVFREDDQVTPKLLWLESINRFNMKMRSIAAVVDSDWNVTYYVIKTSLDEKPEIKPEIQEKIKLDDQMTRVEIAHGGAILFQGDIGSIHQNGILGTKLGDTLLVSGDEDMLISRGDQADNSDRGRIYRDLRSKGWLARTGFKYGAHFRVYTSMSLEDHSRFLVHAVKEDHEYTWEELSRPLRLSHSVRKRFLFGFFPTGVGEPHYKGDGPVYLEMEWFRP